MAKRKVYGKTLSDDFFDIHKLRNTLKNLITVVSGLYLFMKFSKPYTHTSVWAQHSMSKVFLIDIRMNMHVVLVLIKISGHIFLMWFSLLFYQSIDKVAKSLKQSLTIYVYIYIYIYIYCTYI